MPAKPLNSEQLADAERLNRLILASKKNQETIAAECGWKTQATVSQYARGKIPLNLEAAIKFAVALRCPVDAFSPRLAALLAPLDQLLSPDFVAPPPDRPSISRAARQLVERIEAAESAGTSSPQLLAALEAVLDLAMQKAPRPALPSPDVELTSEETEHVLIHAVSKLLAAGKQPVPAPFAKMVMKLLEAARLEKRIATRQTAPHG